MTDIIRIVIKGASGYCCVEEAFNDKVTITPESISYEYTPVVESEINPRRKWSYKTNSPIYIMKYKTLVSLMHEMTEIDIDEYCTDIGEIEFIITYSDKSKYHKTNRVSSHYFEDQFKIIKSMVPECEYIPAVLITSSDLENNKQ